MNSNNSSEKEETKTNKIELMKQIFKSIEQNNSTQFKEIITSKDVPSLNQNTINSLLNQSFIMYNQGNINQKEIISFLLNYGANPNIKINFNIHKDLNQKKKRKR